MIFTEKTGAESDKGQGSQRGERIRLKMKDGEGRRHALFAFYILARTMVSGHTCCLLAPFVSFLFSKKSKYQP